MIYYIVYQIKRRSSPKNEIDSPLNVAILEEMQTRVVTESILKPIEFAIVNGRFIPHQSGCQCLLSWFSIRPWRRILIT